MSPRSMVRTALVLVCLAAAASASAQSLGTFRWNLAPSCNVVTLVVTQTGYGFTATGFDDACGGGPPFPAHALFVLGDAPSVYGTMTQVLPDGSPLFTSLELSTNGFSGTWSDSAGNSGLLVFSPTSTSGSRRRGRHELWAYVISSGGLHATSGGITVTHPNVGDYCVVIDKRYSHKAAQVTLADPGGARIVSVGTGHGSSCNPLVTDTTDAVPVYVRTTAGAPVDGNFTIVIPER